MSSNQLNSTQLNWHFPCPLPSTLGSQHIGVPQHTHGMHTRSPPPKPAPERLRIPQSWGEAEEALAAP